jgi:hypothetical protein
MTLKRKPSRRALVIAGAAVLTIGITARVLQVRAASA